MAKSIREQVSALGRAAAVKLGLGSDDASLWRELRTAIDAADDDAVERLQVKLGLTPKHVEFCRLAVRLHNECAEALTAAERARKRIDVIDGEVEMLSRMSPATVAEATKLAARREELRAERQACLVTAGQHDAHSGVDGFVPELFGLPRGRPPYAGCNHELYNFAREAFDVDLYSKSWLTIPRPATPSRRAKVRAAVA